jgi:4-hydroxy-tetrahydrodipicolinate reductase
MPLRVCLAGATGWAGSALARAIVASSDLELVAGVSRQHAKEPISAVLGIANSSVTLSGSAEQALAVPCDVFVEYTRPEVAKANVTSALSRGVPTVIGTSGLSDADLAQLGALAEEHRVGLLAVGNFSLAAVALMQCAQLAARYCPQYEIIDYASATKPDAPSGTVRELAQKLAQVHPSEPDIPIASTQGPVETRGATLHGIQVHAVRLPGHVISVEVLLGVGDEKLSLRYDAGTSAEPYVEGALLAIRRVGTFRGLKRGLDSVMEGV